jgi:hypothetical protein
LEGTVLYDPLQSLSENLWPVLPKPLFRQMANLRGSFLSGIPAQKDYGTYREFIKLIQEAHRRTKGWQVLCQPRDQSPAERRINAYAYTFTTDRSMWSAAATCERISELLSWGKPRATADLDFLVSVKNRS